MNQPSGQKCPPCDGIGYIYASDKPQVNYGITCTTCWGLGYVLNYIQDRDLGDENDDKTNGAA
jgi:hypothetical protein